MTWALIIAILAGGLGCALLWGAWQSAEKNGKLLLAQSLDLKRQLQSAWGDLKVEQAKAADEQKRLEMLVTSMRTEVTALEADLTACRDPAVIRNRLRKLFGATAPPVPGVARDPDPTPLAGVVSPYGPTR